MCNPEHGYKLFFFYKSFKLTKMKRYSVTATTKTEYVKITAETSEEILERLQNNLDQSQLWSISIYDTHEDEFCNCHENGLITYKGKKYLDYSITELLN